MGRGLGWGDCFQSGASRDIMEHGQAGVMGSYSRW